MANSTDVPVPANSEAFVQLLIGEQFRLLHYITMLLGDPHAANNVLQETNLVLWRKANEFTPGTSFSAWSQKVAYWQVQAFARDRRRDRLVFDKQLIEQLANSVNGEGEETDARLALRHCLKSTSTDNIQLLRARYEEDLSIAALAERLGKTQSSIKVRLMRLRQALQRCIETKLAESQ